MPDQPIRRVARVLRRTIAGALHDYAVAIKQNGVVMGRGVRRKRADLGPCPNSAHPAEGGGWTGNFLRKYAVFERRGNAGLLGTVPTPDAAGGGLEPIAPARARIMRDHHLPS
jgi:hypothetical protein